MKLTSGLEHLYHEDLDWIVFHFICFPTLGIIPVIDALRESRIQELERLASDEDDSDEDIQYLKGSDL